MKTSLVIPAYNEEKRLGQFLKSIERYLAHHRQDISEVLVVDDGSQDRTLEIAHKFKPRLRNLKVLRHAKNRGKGAAVQTGVMAAKGDYIIFMDADGATDISELPKIVRALQGADIAVGNRWMAGAKTTRHSLLRKLAGWIYRHYMRLFGLGAIDTMCGCKGYQRTIARQLFANLTDERWLFDVEVAYKATHHNYHITNVPIRWESKDGSKLSTLSLVKSALHIFPLIRRINLSEKKLVL